MTIEHFKEGDLTHYHSNEMVELAEQMLIQYFSEFGSKRPGDLEDDLCGGAGFEGIFDTPLGNWRKSPFYPALGRLVDKEKVKYWTDENHIVWYALFN